MYGNDLISQDRGGVRSYYHVDGLGSARALTNASGIVTDRYVYDAFGRTIEQTGSTPNVYLFAGEQRDANVGLDYLRARYLSVGAGRFYGMDPLPGVQFFPSTLHRFIHADQNPVNNVDPTGQYTQVFALPAIMSVLLKDFSIPLAGTQTRSLREKAQLAQMRVQLQAGEANLASVPTVAKPDRPGPGVTVRELQAALFVLWSTGRGAIASRFLPEFRGAIIRTSLWAELQPPTGVTVAITGRLTVHREEFDVFRVDTENLRGHNLRNRS